MITESEVDFEEVSKKLSSEGISINSISANIKKNINVDDHLEGIKE